MGICYSSSVCSFDEAEESMLVTDFPEELHSDTTPECRNTLSLLTANLCIDDNEEIWGEFGDSNTISGNSVRSQASNYSQSTVGGLGLSITAVQTRPRGGLFSLPLGKCMESASPLPGSDTPPIMPLRTAIKLYSNSSNSVSGSYAPLTKRRVRQLASLSAAGRGSTRGRSRSGSASIRSHSRTVSSLTDGSARGSMHLPSAVSSCASTHDELFADEEEEEDVLEEVSIYDNNCVSSDLEDDHTTVQSWGTAPVSLYGDDSPSLRSLSSQSQLLFVGGSGSGSGGGSGSGRGRGSGSGSGRGRGPGGSSGYGHPSTEKERKFSRRKEGKERRKARDRSSAE